MQQLVILAMTHIARSKEPAVYQLLATDMDQTLLDDAHRVGAANIAAWAELQALGCMVVPSSGRAHDSILESLAEVPAELLRNSYIISYNGSCITRMSDDKLLVSNQMSAARVQALFKYGRDLDCVSMHIYELSGRCWGWRLQQDEVNYLAGHMSYEPTDAPELPAIQNVPMAKILYCIPNGDAKLQEILAHMPQELLEGVSTTFSSGRYLEFNPQGVDKGAGLRRLAKLLNIDLANTIACGDAANDLEMVRAAGCGVAVANAIDGLPEVANYRSSATNNDGILADVLEHVVKPALQSEK